MSQAKETIGRTIGIVVAVCFVCAIVVSAAAVGLRHKQHTNALLDKRTKILDAAGLSGKDGSVQSLFDQYIIEKFLDLNTGEYIPRPEAFAMGYDFDKVARDPQFSSVPRNDIAKIQRRPDIVPVYLVKKSPDSGEIVRIVLPVKGSGLWGQMLGFVALETDARSTERMVYFQQKETPGLGGEVENPKWKAMWKDKKIYDEQGNLKIRMVKGDASNDPYGFDALSGATLTSRGVENTFRFWFGEEGYANYLKNVRQRGVLLGGTTGGEIG